MTLSGSVLLAGWARLLPAHRADGDDQPAGEPRLLGTLPLADGLVLTVLEDERGRTYPAPLVVTRDGVRRAVPGEGAAEALVALLAGGRGAGDEGDGFRLSTWHHEPAAGERAITVDQTNESVVVGDAVVVKWAFLAEEGPHPAPSLLGVLAASGFRGTPTPWGALEWEGRLLALAVAFVPGAVDGWTWAVEDLATLDLDRVAASAARVGALVADFHRALAPTSRPATVEETAAWRTDALADLDRALATRPPVLLQHAEQVREALTATVPADVAVQRVHGDLHVGQALRADGYVLTDFDGNPVVPAAERTREQPVELDVAGMAQSFTHAGIVVRRHHPDLDPAAVDEAAATARASFLAAYGDVDAGLLRAFSLRQVCREFTYAATHLPRWSYVPEAALPMLLREDRP